MGWLVRVLAVIVGLVLLVGPASPVSAGTVVTDRPGEVVLQLFWGDGCPHCAAEKQWLEQAVMDYPGLVVQQFEVWNDEGNQQLFHSTAERMGFEPSGVPTTIIGDRYWVGWSDTVRDEIVAEYAAKSDRDVSAIEFYVVFALYKLAVITEGIYRRFIEGKAIGRGLEQYAESSVELANYALELASRSQIPALRGG